MIILKILLFYFLNNLVGFIFFVKLFNLEIVKKKTNKISD